MKQEKIWCDICGKEMGKMITFDQFKYPSFDSGFYKDGTVNKDYCKECLDRINKVIDEEIKKIKEEKK